MDATSVVLIGSIPPAMDSAVPGAFTVPPFDDDDTWVARTALAITQACQDQVAGPPLLLVLAESSARHAPQLGFAQRAARRAVRGYVLVDPELPRPGAVSDWPDAPVTVVLTHAEDPRARDAHLRGWEVLVGDPSRIIADLAARP